MDKKLAYVIPNFFTTLNMACGFMAIILAFKGTFYLACIFVMVGAIFDLVDGRIARWMGVQSSFGEQLDSLSDLITFALAPSLIFYQKFLIDSGRFGMIASFIYLAAGAFRLARFNANVGKVNPNFFQGLPSPSAALAVVGFVLFQIEMPFLNEYPKFFAVYIILYAVLMISTFPFPAFKQTSWVVKNRQKFLAICLMTLLSILIYEEIMVFVVINVYVIGSLVYFFLHKRKSNNLDILPDEDHEDHDAHGVNGTHHERAEK
ncbi:MAG: CDP-diacylglycerol--serine O-phosphatidyltransferase [Bacteriovoracaceae bacterium]|nr:CDP-diacylglycerol--serine O-phosphatidyltransferase [Bacteriovoracaceae bacterium]